MNDLHQLDLVVLVHAKHSAGVLAVASRFGAKARCMRCELERERSGGYDLVAHKVGQGNLGGRDQIHSIFVRRSTFGHPEQVILEFWQLAGAHQRRPIDDIRQVTLEVAMFGRVQVEHPLRQRAVKARNVAAQRMEPGPRKLGRNIELDATDRSADIDVVARFKSKCSWRPDASKLHVLRLRGADRYARVWQVRYFEQPIAQIGLDDAELGFERLELVAETGDFGHQRFGVLAAAFGSADFLGHGIAPGLQLLGAGLDRLATRFGRFESGHIEHVASCFQARRDRGRIVAQKLDVEHRPILAKANR